MENWQKAIEAGCRAVDLNYDYPDAHYNLARIFELKGDELAAQRHMRNYRKLLDGD